LRINLAQGSAEWISWRSQGIGGSDIGSVVGINPYKDMLTLWREKTGLDKPADLSENTRVARGHLLENEARLIAQVELDFIFTPETYQHDEHPQLRSSLDGISEDEKTIIEIKCPSKATHNEAKDGEIKPYYLAQCHYNMFVSGADVCFYVSYNPKDTDKDTFVYKRIERNPGYMEYLKTYALIFWEYVEKKVEPDFVVDAFDWGLSDN
jgi:putative phage-type endonuclease